MTSRLLLASLAFAAAVAPAAAADPIRIGVPVGLSGAIWQPAPHILLLILMFRHLLPHILSVVNK